MLYVNAISDNNWENTKQMAAINFPPRNEAPVRKVVSYGTGKSSGMESTLHSFENNV